MRTCEGEACRECDQNHEDDLDNCPCQKNCPCKYIVAHDKINNDIINCNTFIKLGALARILTVTC